MVTDSPQGAIVAVRAITRAGRTEVAGIRDGAVIVRLNAPPVDGEANAELIDLMARTLRVPKVAITIKAGESWRRKTLLIAGLSAAAVLTRLGV